MIYVVKQGDSVYSIAQKNNTTPATIVALNELPSPDVLVVGQALVLPETPDPNRPSIETNGYIEWYGNTPPPLSLLTEVQKRAPQLTYMMPFSYEVKRDGTITPMNWGTIPEIASGNNAHTAIVLTNIDGTGFSDTLAHDIFMNTTTQDSIINAAIQEAKVKGAKEISVDFEYLMKEDRPRYVAFLKRFREKAHANGLGISAAIPPKINDEQVGKWYEGHDYKGIGEAVDFVVVMTYDWGYSGGPPMAISPIGPVRKVLTFALSQIPANKIMMGQNLYGYDWTLPYKTGNPPARIVSPQQALRLAKERNAAIQYDTKSQAPFFRYWRDGKEHIVWFEDARSIQAKFNLLNELKLRGISYWHMGFPFPQNWSLMRQMFKVKKKQ